MLPALIASLASPEVWLESALRDRFAQVTRWDIREVRAASVRETLTPERYELGHVGSRTLVLVHGRSAQGREILQQRWFEVSAYQPAVVTLQTLYARTELSAQMLSVMPIDLMGQSCTPLTDPAAAVGFRILEARREGEALCASMLAPVPAVQRGTTVSVTVRVGAVALVTEAVARSDARVGERLSLYRASDHTYFFGVVSAPGEVQIK